MKKPQQKLTRSELQAEATTLFIAGLSVREIAKRLNSSPATISRITRTLSSPTQVSPSASQSEIGGVSQSDEGVNTHQPCSPSQPCSPQAHSRPCSPISSQEAILSKAHSAIDKLIRQIETVADGETDVAKLATAADKLSTIAERVTNLARLTADSSNDSQFTTDFARRHQQLIKS